MRRVSILLVLLLSAGLVGSQNAHATFPGRNGRIAYWVSDGGDTSIRTVDPRRRGSTRVLRHCRNLTPDSDPLGCAVSPGRFSPDGRRIAYYVTRYDGRGGAGHFLGIMRADGSHPHETGVPANFSETHWSPDGRRLLVEVYDGNLTNLFVIDLAGRILRQVTTEGADGGDWSSTGRIAFVTQANCRRRVCDEVYVTRAGRTPKRLTYRGGFSASWAPDGRHVLFTRDLLGGHTDVFSVGLSGRSPHRITRRIGDEGRLSPDGRFIVFERYFSIYLGKTAGGRARLLVEGDDFFAGGPQVGGADWQPLPARKGRR
jgi:Tol biopolymer transport system component